MSEIEETIKRIVTHKGIEAVVIVNTDGIPIRTWPATMEHKDAVLYPALLLPLKEKVRAALPLHLL